MQMPTVICTTVLGYLMICQRIIVDPMIAILPGGEANCVIIALPDFFLRQIPVCSTGFPHLTSSSCLFNCIPTFNRLSS